jgi:chemotaxis signal transduction protein
MPVGHVLEVAELGQVRCVPGARPELLGIRNLRGQILPVVDLALLLGVERTAPPRCLLLAEAGGRQAGFAIDEVTGIGELADLGEETESALLLGAALSEGDLVGVIDIPRVFDSIDGNRL